jgi:hypothetical protein
MCVSSMTRRYSEQALVELQRKAAEQIRAVLEGRTPDYPVNTIEPGRRSAQAARLGLQPCSREAR